MSEGQRPFAEGELLRTWEDMRRRETARRGRLRPQWQEFGEHAGRSLALVAHQIRAATYRPSPLTGRQIGKPRGGRRFLALPGVLDQVVERVATARLDPLVDATLLPTSFAYRKGLGVSDATSALLRARDEGASLVLRTDLQDCFGSIARTTALADLRGVVDDELLLAVVTLLLARQVEGPRPPDGSRLARGLWQGVPLSPLLANLVLDRLDRSLTDRGRAVVRFGDDIVIPLQREAEAVVALADVRAAAEAMGLQLNEDKSAVERFDVGVHFLGQTLTNATLTTERSIRPLKATVFVTGPKAQLRSKGDRLRVEVDGEERLSLNLNRVRQVVCHGQVGMTTPLLHRAMGLGIDVVLLSAHGRYIGRCASTGHVRAGSRRRQYLVATDPERTLALARRFVDGKLTNLRTGVVRWSRGKDLPGALAVVKAIEAQRAAAAGAPTLAALMGCEGAASTVYFRHLAALLGPEWGFTHRTRRPPRDPVSSMLSFGYALLTTELIGAAEVAGLDPVVGFLHAEGRGRPSLALDLIEEFRPVLVDSLDVRLVSTRAMTPGDFDTSEERGVLLTDEGRRRYFAAYERRLLQPFSHAATGRRVNYRTALSLQAGLLAASLEHGDPYEPVRWK